MSDETTLPETDVASPETTPTTPEPEPEPEPTVPEPVSVPTKLVNFDELKAGQTIRLHERITDVSAKGEPRERVQVFEGMILGLRGSGVSRTLTIRKMSGTVSVEKIYPVNSPVIVKMELVKTARVRRAKLSFIGHLKKQFNRKLKETYV